MPHFFTPDLATPDGQSPVRTTRPPLSNRRGSTPQCEQPGREHYPARSGEDRPYDPKRENRFTLARAIRVAGPAGQASGADAKTLGASFEGAVSRYRITTTKADDLLRAWAKERVLQAGGAPPLMRLALHLVLWLRDHDPMRTVAKGKRWCHDLSRAPLLASPSPLFLPARELPSAERDEILEQLRHIGRDASLEQHANTLRLIGRGRSRYDGQ